MEQKDWCEKDFADSVRYFPLIGLVLGIIYAAFAALLLSFLPQNGILLPHHVVAAILLILPILLTGGLHCDGFMDTMDGLFSGRSRERMLEIPWQQARYLQADQKTVFLITGDGAKYELPKTLVYWEELLGEKVIRVHRNALVMRHTLDSLIRLDGDDDDSNASWGAKVLDVEEVLPVSRRQLSAIRRILREGA